MYHPVKVAKISTNQRSKLVKGQPVRIKPGNQTTIHLSAPQIKKMAKAHQMGKGITVQFDPYQAEQHGCGFFGNLYDKAKALYDKGKAFYEKNKDNALMKAGVQHLRKQAHQRINEYANEAKENEYNPQLIKQLSNYAHQKVQGKGIFGSVGSFIGNKIASKIPIIGDVAGPLITKGTNYLGEQVDKKLGTGRKKKVKHIMNPMLMKRKGGALKPAGM